MGLIFKHVQLRMNSYQKNSLVSLRVPWLVSAIVSTMDGGLTMYFSDMMLSILLKHFHYFLAVPFPLFLLLSFSILYFCLSLFILFMTSLTVNSLIEAVPDSRKDLKRFTFNNF